MLNNFPKSLCILPWISIEATPLGNTRPCCNSTEKITKDDGSLFDLRTETLVEAYKSSFMQKLRQDFRNGIKPDACKSCWDEESSNKISKRLHTINIFHKEIKDIDFNNDIPNQLWFLDLKLGTICNLKCRICGDWSSSKWASENIERIRKENVNYKTLKSYQTLKQGEWPKKTTVFWDNLKNLLPNIKRFDFTGGEPFMIEEHIDVLECAVENNLSQNIKIHYNTNCTYAPSRKLIDLWSKFALVDIAFSVDNIGSRFEYERTGAKWIESNQNIDRIHSLKDSMNNLSTQHCLTLNIQNIYYIEEIIEWSLTKKFTTLYFNILHYPKHMSIFNLTDQAKTMVIDKLKDININIEINTEIKNLINLIVNSLGSNGKDFCNYMLEIDQYRNEDFSLTHPEIAKAMGYEKT